MSTYRCTLCRVNSVTSANKVCGDCARLITAGYSFIGRITGVNLAPAPTMRAVSPHGLRLGLLPSHGANIARRVQLRAFLDLSKLPPLPATYDPPSDYKVPMYLNDQLGICGPAACAHAVGQNSLISNQSEVIFPDDTMRQWYFGITGGQDSGVDMEQMFGYWLRNPLGGERLLGYAFLTPGDIRMLRACQYIFEGAVVAGFSLPDRVLTGDWLAQPWTGTDGAPSPYNGHAVSLPGWSAADRTYVTTWANDEDRMDSPFYSKYCDSPAVVFTESILNKATQLSAGGLDAAGLLAAIKEATGRDPLLPPDNPPPGPGPGPNPNPGGGCNMLRRVAAAVLWPSGVRL